MFVTLRTKSHKDTYRYSKVPLLCWYSVASAVELEGGSPPWRFEDLIATVIWAITRAKAKVHERTQEWTRLFIGW